MKRPPAPNESFWKEAIDDRTLEPPLRGQEETEVALLGGGYTSLVAACFLKRLRPDLHVSLLESHYVGFGSSGRSAGMVIHDLHPERIGKHGERVLRVEKAPPEHPDHLPVLQDWRAAVAARDRDIQDV